MRILFFQLNSIFLVRTQWILYLLSPQQKTLCVKVYQYLIEQIANKMDYLNNVITAGEIWIYYYYPTFKQETSK